MAKSKDSKRRLSQAAQQLSSTYALQGFAPSWPVEYVQFDFTMDDVIESLTQSTFDKPRWVTFRLTSLTNELGAPIRVVISSLAKFYFPNWSEQGFPLGCLDYPDYIFDGRIVKEAAGPRVEPTYVHGSLPTMGSKLGGDGHIQIRTAPPSSQLVCIEY